MLLLDSSVCGLFKWRQFEPEVILLAIGWYLRFSLSYRDVEELLAERGLSVDHVTVWRWVQRYALELERRLPPRYTASNSPRRTSRASRGNCKPRISGPGTASPRLGGEAMTPLLTAGCKHFAATCCFHA